jgi:magnesium transporter
VISTLVYRDHRLVAHLPDPNMLAQLRIDPAVMLWVDLAEPTDAEIRLIMEELLGIHPLTIEDCVQESPAPKLEPYEDYLYLVMHAVDYSRAAKFASIELDLVLGRNFLVTFHRRPVRAVQTVRDRLRRAAPNPVRGPDRIAHTLLDVLVENYQPALAELRAETERIELAVLSRSREPLAAAIVELREDLARLRRIVRPQRELVAQLASGQTAFFRPKLLPYLRDLHHQLLHLEQLSQAWSEQTFFAFRLHLNRSSHEANEGIRVLTGLTALSIPLLILGSWFAMNFANMPLLDHPAAYWTTMGVTAALTGAMFVYLKRRRWF